MSDPALPRFMAMQAARAAGAAIALLGVVMLSHRIALLAWAPDALGDGLIVAGAVLFFAVPLILAKRWKSRG